MKAAIIILIFFSNFCYAQDKTSSWHHYNISDVGLDLPDFFSKGVSNQLDTYSFTNSVSKSISMSVMCLRPNSTSIPGSLESYHDDCLHFFDTIMYEYTKGSIFILSGLDKKGKVLYIKGVQKGKSYFEFDLSYDKKYQFLFDKTLTKIAASFK